MTTASHFSLLVVDDEPDLRTLYELTLLREGYDLDTAGTVQEALLHLKDRTYSAVITDMRLPDGSGLDILRWLEEGGRREKAIVITAYGSSENAVEALKSGASGYVLKSAADRDLVEACRAAMRGEPFLYPAAIGALIRDFLERARSGEEVNADPLTPRELEVLKLVAKGMSNREIGDQLFISENTVKNHIRNILEKLHLHSRMEAVIYAVREHLLDIRADG